MSHQTQDPKVAADNLPKTSAAPGSAFEVRQTSKDEDYTPDPSKSIKLSPARQALLDDILALYEMKPTIERVKRYTPDMQYIDQFVHCDNRYKMAYQWFALPKLFKAAKIHRYEVVTNEPLLIQFKNEESWTFKVIPKTATINALVSLSLDPDSVDSDFIQVKSHKDQANGKDYSNEGPGFWFKKWQTDNVPSMTTIPEAEAFAADKDVNKGEPVHKHGSGTANAPLKDL